MPNLMVSPASRIPWLGRNYLWFRRGDAANAVLAAVGYNFRRLIRWLRILLCQILIALTAALQPVPV
jgi:IS5 family transposase